MDQKKYAIYVMKNFIILVLIIFVSLIVRKAMDVKNAIEIIPYKI